MNDLPEELVIEMASFLPAYDALRLSQINSRFYRATSNNMFWKPLVMCLFPKVVSKGEEEERIQQFETERCINWKLLFFLVSPSRFDQFDSNQKGDKIILTQNDTRVAMEQTGQLHNCSIQTLKSFIPKNQRFYIWEFHVIHHTNCNMSLGVADRYLSMNTNFVGYSGMLAPTNVVAPSFSCSSDGILRDGTDTTDKRAKLTYASGDRITMIVDCIDARVNVSTNCYAKFYSNGKFLGSVKLKNMNISREYFPTVTFYSDLDEGEICTQKNCNNGNVYSVSVLEVLHLYYRAVEKLENSLDDSDESSTDNSNNINSRSDETQKNKDNDKGFIRRLFKRLLF